MKETYEIRERNKENWRKKERETKKPWKRGKSNWLPAFHNYKSVGDLSHRPLLLKKGIEIKKRRKKKKRKNPQKKQRKPVKKQKKHKENQKAT